MKQKIKQFIKSKSCWSGVSAIVAGAGIYAETGNKTALVLAAYGFVQIAIRYFTTEAMGDKK